MTDIVDGYLEALQGAIAFADRSFKKAGRPVKATNFRVELALYLAYIYNKLTYKHAAAGRAETRFARFVAAVFDAAEIEGEARHFASKSVELHRRGRRARLVEP